ncbi:MAG: DUF1848 domain-containing protein [Methanomassiliicoccaceae archaeon]|jgi:hypothetical protein|nr:DUF1848 domain-containing protein [Methanomassiliicoccaceae archaeon]
MIISASRRTDIPAFYSEWFFNRLNEGYALVPNPYNADRLGRVELSPKNVDCIVFWTKNAEPMLDKFLKLDEMGYPYCVHFTMTPYGRDIEKGLPPKPILMETFRKMSERIGAERSVWRYDPVIVDAEHPVGWHLERFGEMCGRLRDHTERCFISFVDPYKSLEKRFRGLTDDETAGIASGFSEIAGTNGIELFTCAEGADLSRYGIGHGACIDQKLIERIIGHRITAKKDANQRNECNCIESVDIGAYSTCPHGCSYCYAVSGRETMMRRVAAHDPNSPMITGHPRGGELITDRTAPSLKNKQTDLSHFK